MGWSSGWKFAKEKKSSDFAYFYHISLYKMDRRARFHEIRYLDPILPGNAFNIWFFLTPMTPCNFLWGSLDGPPPQDFAPNKNVRTRLSWIWPNRTFKALLCKNTKMTKTCQHHDVNDVKTTSDTISNTRFGFLILFCNYNLYG